MVATPLKTSSGMEEWDELLSKKHYDEWLSSAVSDKIIRLNLKTISDPREIDKILGRNTKRRWKHSNDLVPAWVASGVDPLTGESTLQGVQVKPDTPPVDKDGKVQKYLAASGMETAPLFLRTGLENYWSLVLAKTTEKIIITEGAKKAASGLTAGYPTVSIPGVSTCRKNGRLHPMLQSFAVLGRTFYLCFDNDVLKKRAVQLALIGLASKLAKDGSNIMVIELPDGPAKGMDDFIAANGSAAFDKLIEEAATFEEWKSSLDESEWEDEKPKSRIARNFEMIEEKWGESLRYNSLKKDIEFDGMPLNAEYLKLMVGLQFPVDISKDDAFTIVEFLAKKNEYSPITEYLDEVEAKFPNIDTSFLDGLAKKFFGTDDPLHAKYFKNFLVASVARARVPGCWMDCALLLFGDQGSRKSSFWRTLYGDDFFSDDLGDGSDKDERMKMHRFWCLEWSEFETVYKRKDINQLKAFLARQTETFRTPYDRLPKDYKRSCLFVGTTNEKEVLNDPSGNRRFWIIPCSGKIPVEDCQKMRDRIWAAANALFKSGYTYRLDAKDEISRETQNQEYEVTHPWSDILDNFVRYKDYVTTQQCFKELGIDPVHQNPANQRQIASILKKLGLDADRVKLDGKWVRVWREQIKIVDSKNENLCGSCGSDENSQPEIVAQQALQPDPVEKHHVDQSGMIPTTNSDPVEEKKGDYGVTAQPQALQPIDPHDPHDPHTKKSEEIKTVVQKDKFAPPPPDDYCVGLKLTPIDVNVDTGYGEATVVCTPYKKYSNSLKIHCLITFPGGKQVVDDLKANDSNPRNLAIAIRDSKIVKTWVDKQKKIWDKRIGEKFKLTRITGPVSDAKTIVKTATLVRCPSSSMAAYFLFDIDGEIINALWEVFND